MIEVASPTGRLTHLTSPYHDPYHPDYGEKANDDRIIRVACGSAGQWHVHYWSRCRHESPNPWPVCTRCTAIWRSFLKREAEHLADIVATTR